METPENRLWDSKINIQIWWGVLWGTAPVRVWRKLEVEASANLRGSSGSSELPQIKAKRKVFVSHHCPVTGCELHPWRTTSKGDKLSAVNTSGSCRMNASVLNRGHKDSPPQHPLTVFSSFIWDGSWLSSSNLEPLRSIIFLWSLSFLPSLLLFPTPNIFTLTTKFYSPPPKHW